MVDSAGVFEIFRLFYNFEISCKFGLTDHRLTFDTGIAGSYYYTFPLRFFLTTVSEMLIYHRIAAALPLFCLAFFTLCLPTMEKDGTLKHLVKKVTNGWITQFSLPEDGIIFDGPVALSAVGLSLWILLGGVVMHLLSLIGGAVAYLLGLLGAVGSGIAAIGSGIYSVIYYGLLAGSVGFLLYVLSGFGLRFAEALLADRRTWGNGDVDRPLDSGGALPGRSQNGSAPIRSDNSVRVPNSNEVAGGTGPAAQPGPQPSQLSSAEEVGPQADIINNQMQVKQDSGVSTSRGDHHTGPAPRRSERIAVRNASNKGEHGIPKQ